MDQPADHDDQLLDQLRAALLNHDLVPDAVSAAARAAFAWRTIDAELAALAYDSFLDDKELAGVRSGAEGARRLTFESGSLTVEVDVEHGRIVGQLVPPQSGAVEVRHAAGSMTVQADGIGRFSCNDVPRGPVSLRCTTSNATAIVTDWLVL